MSPIPRRPAIAGAAQFLQRVDDPREAREPIAMMEQALRDAASDAGTPRLLEAIDTILVPQGTWHYGDPAALLAERVGAGSVETGIGIVSGHIVQVLVDWACAEIAAGQRDVVAIVGGESENSKRQLQKTGDWPTWNEEIPGEPDRRFGSYEGAFSQAEVDIGINKPSVCFALCETALRGERGATPAEHRRHISELSSRLSAVAAKNPHAWIQRHVSAEEIATPTRANRMVSYPYTKLMTANISVDQSAALIVCSEETATRFGIAPERLVYLRAATQMNHATLLSERRHLYEHPGMHVAGQRVLELAGADASDLAHVDLYSCFPFAVEAGAASLGLDETRPLSVTGGLTFSGGPFGNYVIQAKARMVELLRADPGSLGLVGSLGGNFTKFAFGVYSSDPGTQAAPAMEDVSKTCAAMPTRPYRTGYTGGVRIESYSVDVLPAGPHRITFSTLTADGSRVWASSDEPQLMDALLADEDVCGREAKVSGGRLEIG